MSAKSSATNNVAAPPRVPYVDPERFAVLVEQARGLALVDFTADWCPPCRIVAPHIDDLSQELSGDVVIVKVDVDDYPDLAARFSVLSLPTMIFLRGGTVIERIVGAVPAAHLRARAHELLRS